MIVLTIDSATPAVTAGLVRVESRRNRILGRENPELTAGNSISAQTLAERVTVDARAHAECLTPNVIAALADAGWTFGDVDAVVVGCGPGPFTGLRVGMATAAAYGHALGVPVYGVCSLDAIGVDTVGDVLVVTDARRREVYWARYHDGVRVEGPAVDAPADVDVGSSRRLEFAHPTPAGLVRGVTDWPADPPPLVPLYLRRPDAKSLAERAVAR